MATFSKCKKGFIGALNENNWLGTDISEVGNEYSKILIDGRFIVQVIDKQVK